MLQFLSGQAAKRMHRQNAGCEIQRDQHEHGDVRDRRGDSRPVPPPEAAHAEKQDPDNRDDLKNCYLDQRKRVALRQCEEERYDKAAGKDERAERLLDARAPRRIRRVGGWLNQAICGSNYGRPVRFLSSRSNTSMNPNTVPAIRTTKNPIRRHSADRSGEERERATELFSDWTCRAIGVDPGDDAARLGGLTGRLIELSPGALGFVFFVRPVPSAASATSSRNAKTYGRVHALADYGS